MKAATVKELKQELNKHSASKLVDLCLQLARFKKENKELLTYLLYEVADEQAYIQSVKQEIDDLISEVNTKSTYFINKSARKVLRITKKYIRYSKKKETEIELLIYYCEAISNISYPINRNTTLYNIYKRQIASVRKIILGLHEDLQYDFNIKLKSMLK